jgi:hypothetical protein
MGPTLELRAAVWEQRLDRHKLSVLAVLTLLYFIITVLSARGKPFWYDEILTILEARQPTISAALHAGHDLDWMPPLSHLPFYAANHLAGTGEVAFRLPSMIGFWIFCLSLFFFVARRASIYFAFMALLLPFATSFWIYAFEARSYALLMGFCGLALLCWQMAADGRMRAWSLAGLALAMACALMNHYWALFMYVPLAGAEAYRSLRMRRIDWPMWAAFLSGGIPLAVSLLLVLRLIHTTLHPWSIAHFSDYFLFYRRNFTLARISLVPLPAFLAIWLFFRGFRERPAGIRPSVRDYEWLAAVLLFSIPLFAIAAARMVPPHTFVDRYLATVTGGLALLIAFGAAQLAGRRAALGLACMIASLAPFAHRILEIQPFQDPFQQAPLLRRALDTQPGPVVISNYVAQLQLWYYAPESLKPRIIGLADEPSSVRYVHYDDVAVEPVRELGVPMVAYGPFAASTKQFLIYYVNWSWLTNKVRDDGGSLECLRPFGPHAELLLARVP